MRFPRPPVEEQPHAHNTAHGAHGRAISAHRLRAWYSKLLIAHQVARNYGSVSPHTSTTHLFNPLRNLNVSERHRNTQVSLISKVSDFLTSPFFLLARARFAKILKSVIQKKKGLKIWKCKNH
jgi:hypothetical protein